MGYKSTIRSLQAAQRRSERESRHKQRELEKQRKQIAMMQEVERARFEVQEYENYIDVITSVHNECGPPWNWEIVNKRPAPLKPMKERFESHETDARKAFAEYEPSRADRLFRRADSRREELVAKIDSARRQDADRYDHAVVEYKEKLQEWEAYHALSTRILNGESEAFLQAIELVDPFSEISELGTRMDLETRDGNLFDISLHVNGEDIIPSKTKTLLKTGRISEKNMTKSRFYELYQDHVCGCALRVAREIFALLPSMMVLVTTTSDVLNASTGHMEVQPVLSVAMPRVTLEGLNFDSLDPSDSLNNFVHNMRFLKTKGFKAVDKLTPDDLTAE